jgi:hypothetical protein
MEQKASNSETTVVAIPLTIPSNSPNMKGDKLQSVEID